MTGIEAEKLLLNETNKIAEVVKEKIAQLESFQKTACKAYKISLGLLNQAEKLVAMKFSSVSHDEKYYHVRENRVFNSVGEAYFSNYKSWYDNNDNTDEKQAFLVYAHAVQMIHVVFLDKKKEELIIAKQTGAVESVFELEMLIDTLTELLDVWKSKWAEEGGILLND